MDTGTDVYFVWNGVRQTSELNEELSALLISEEFGNAGGGNCWKHRTFGRVALTGFKSDNGHTKSCLSFDCELLPELNDPGFERQSSPPIEVYHLARRIFTALDVDECFASTQSDGVSYFNFEDPLISRIFSFNRIGPQRLVRPYEEKRPVSFADLARDSATGEPNGVLHLGGPLPDRVRP